MKTVWYKIQSEFWHKITINLYFKGKKINMILKFIIKKYISKKNNQI